MRRPRCLRPNAFWSVVINCVGRRHRLRPDTERVQLIGFWLARAQAACPAIKLFGITTMSNHIHMELQDPCAELSEFMRRFTGPLARAINALDGLTGPVFDRYRAIEVLDLDAMHDRLVYSMHNPVAAGLVRRTEDWPGLAIMAKNQTVTRTFKRFRHSAYYRAQVLGAGVVNKDEFYEEATLVVKPCDGVDPQAVQDELRSRQLIENAPVLGADQAKAISPLYASTKPRRSPLPLCHTTCSKLWMHYKQWLSGWIGAFRVASKEFRAGNFAVKFPNFAFRPPVPLLN